MADGRRQAGQYEPRASPFVRSACRFLRLAWRPGPAGAWVVRGLRGGRCRCRAGPGFLPHRLSATPSITLVFLFESCLRACNIEVYSLVFSMDEFSVSAKDHLSEI